MGRYFDYDKTIEYAVEHGEFDQILRGEGIYSYEDRITSGPVQHIALITSIYKYALDNDRVIGLFIDELNKLSKGSIDDKLLCLQYLLNHLYLKNKKVNTFDFDIDGIFDSTVYSVNEASTNNLLLDENEKYISFYDKKMRTYGYTGLKYVRRE